MAAGCNFTCKDPLYGRIALHPWCAWVIGRPEFRRLAGIRQLGFAAEVFPAASHTRYDHSVGVAHLACVLMSSLASNQPRLAIGADDEVSVALAALCHDIGHGPLSHVWDMALGIICPHVYPEHELRSQAIVRSFAEARDCPIPRAVLDVVAWLIRPAASDCPLPEAKRWMGDIVCNEQHGVDIDKLDYLARDAHYLQRDPSHDGFSDVVRRMRVVRTHSPPGLTLAFHEGDAERVVSMSRSRQAYHQKFYCHPRVLEREQRLLRALSYDLSLIRTQMAAFPHGASVVRAQRMGSWNKFDDAALLRWESRLQATRTIPSFKHVGLIAHTSRAASVLPLYCLAHSLPLLDPETVSRSDRYVVVEWKLFVNRQAPDRAIPLVPLHDGKRLSESRIQVRRPKCAVGYSHVFLVLDSAETAREGAAGGRHTTAPAPIADE